MYFFSRFRHFYCLFCLVSVQFLFRVTTDVGAMTQIELQIVTPGLLQTVNNILPSTTALSGPAFDVSIENLRHTLPNFNISQTYLYHESTLDCATLQQEVQVLMAEWYYRIRSEKDMVVIITPGDNHANLVSSFLKYKDILFYLHFDKKQCL